MIKLSHLPAVALITSAVLLGCDAQTPRTRPAASQNDGGRRTFALEDPTLQMTAATVTLPDGWGFAGTVVHAQNCVVSGDSLKVNFESPGGLTGVQMLPTLIAEGSTVPQAVQQMRQQGCAVTQSTHAADFIKANILPHFRPGAQIVSVADEPEFAGQVQQLKQQMAQFRQQNPPPRGGMITMLEPVIESARVRISYTRNGQPVEEAVSAVTMCSVSQYNTMRYSTMQCTADSIIAVHAPAGQLDALLATKPPFKMTFHPAWQQRLQQYQQQRQQQKMAQMQAQNQSNQAQSQAQLNANLKNINGAAARSQAAADAITQRGQTFRNIDQNRQNAIDHAAQGTALSVNNTNTFQNANGTNYSGLSNNYAHTYDDGQGTILQTNSAYAPGSPAIWTELTPKY